MEQLITGQTVRQFIAKVSDQHHAMTGAVIAVSAAQAAALGEACMQISLDNQVDKLNWGDVTARIEQMVSLKNTLIEWCDRDAEAIANYIDLREAGDPLTGQRFLCESPAEIGRLSIAAAVLLQDFRSLVFKQVQDDLEMVISLLTGTARTAMMLLDQNLRTWPDNDALAAYEPILNELKEQINKLTPVC